MKRNRRYQFYLALKTDYKNVNKAKGKRRMMLLNEEENVTGKMPSYYEESWRKIV